VADEIYLILCICHPMTHACSICNQYDHSESEYGRCLELPLIAAILLLLYYIQYYCTYIITSPQAGAKTTTNSLISHHRSALGMEEDSSTQGSAGEQEGSNGEHEGGTLLDKHSSAGSSMEVCFICGGTPCEWDEYGAEMLENLEATYPKDDQGQHIDPSTGLPVPLNTVRFALYQSFIYLKYGHLGRFNRIPLPQCIEDKIKETYPDPDGNFVGFQAAPGRE